MKNLRIYPIILYLFILLAFVNTAVSQNTCATAEHLDVEMYSTCGLMALKSIDFASATASTQTPNPTCGGFSSSSKDLWYTFEVPASINTMAFHVFNSDVVAGLLGTSEPALAVYRGTDCSSLTLLACFESSAGFMQNGEIRWEQVNGLNPGETIYMRVWDQGNQDQSIFICASVRLDMQEDDCDTPIDLSTGGCNILSTGGDITAPEQCGWNSTDNSIFFNFTVTADDPQPYTISVEEGECWANSGGESAEIQFAIYEWNGSSCSGIGGSGSSYMGCASGTGTVTFSQNLAPGDYMLAMDGYSMLSGNSLCLFGFDAPFIDPQDITASLNTTPESCGELGTASITIIQSCTGNPNIQWSTGQTGTNISNLEAGSYSYTITDGVDCDTIIEQFTITTNNNFSVDAFTTGDACDEFISATAEVTGATSGQCTFAWNTTPAQSSQVAQINESGTYTVTATFGTCVDTDEITIELFDHILLSNFSDNICAGGDYTVSFDVFSSGGGPATFNVDLGGGDTQHTGSFSTTYPSGDSYSITITDLNGCDVFAYNGQTDCGCLTFAGTMLDITPLTLCADECTDMIVHNGDEDLDVGDVFEFIVHDGGYPGVIYARGTDPEFCFSELSVANYGQTYYISAIAGPDLGSGYVNQSDPCYSQSPGVPVVWLESPISFISANELTTCGLEITLTASPPELGMTGTWGSTGIFFPINGTSTNNSTINVIANDYGDQTFTFYVNNGICSGSDDVLVHFLETPTAYAGSDYPICGNIANLEATPSVSGSTGQWTGNGSFVNTTSPITDVTANTFGVVSFTWRENVGICWDEDIVRITFIQEPNPTVTSLYDSVCGNVATISVSNSIYSGSWSAFVDGNPLPGVTYSPSYTSPTAQVTIGNYPTSEYSRTVEFIWTETNELDGHVCTETATQFITFAREPIASVGAVNSAEICGNCFVFGADTVGNSWAQGTWISPDVLATFDNSHLPNAEVCINPLGSFGDSAYVTAPFIWAVKNTGCTSLDTMWLTFYKEPTANAGLDKKICGKDYNLGAVFSLTETESYTPFGSWSVLERPIVGSSADINPQTGDSTHVTVSHYGSWVFEFRENNSNLSSCHSTDTVRINFIEIPIIDAGPDKDVCGTHTQMECISGGHVGTWVPNGVSFIDYNNPTTAVQSSSYGSINFVWLESNDICSSKDTVKITFWKIPEADILTDLADSTTCGLEFCNLRAENPGSGITGYWYTQNPATQFDDPFDEFTCANVPNYGYHNFYWIEESGPAYATGFCNDTAGPLRIHFIEIPVANAGIDILFCGYSGYLDAVPSTGTGVWSTPSAALIDIENINDPDSYIESQILNTGNPTNPYFNLIWTEDATNGCTDSDTVKVVFARIPNSKMNIIPPKCFGEPASIAADEDSLQQYTWNFYSGAIDSTSINPLGGQYENFVYWSNTDTLHRISLIATNHWGCQSTINIDTVYEPSIPKFDVTIISDTCMLGKGGLIFGDTLSNNSFFWLDTVYGPPTGPVTTVNNIPTGEYYIRTSYQTPNMTYYSYYLSTFNSANCVDTILYEIEPIGMIEALIEISTATDIDELVAPEATVIFLNNSIYDNVGKRCEWHFGDGETLKNCDQQVEHVYTEADCFVPFLIVMNRDLPECRDTAYLEACIKVDNASKLEVPNIFSPNSDGHNDFFQVKAQTLRTFSGIIVNRYGRTVYEWDNWQDYEAGWDGKLKGGTKASPGVYYYIIKATGMDDEPHDLQGALHLVRD